MKPTNLNNESENNLDKELSDFLAGAKIPYKKTREDVWDNLSKEISTVPSSQRKTIRLKFAKYSIAASIILLLGLFSFMFFSTKTIVAKKAQHLTAILPDASEVNLNAQSTLSYRPYWWRFKRVVNFEGEAFFTVEKGKRFTIVSNNGITEILGTSFNIYARNTDYKVYCLSGKVKVTDPDKKLELVITPGKQADIKSGVIQEPDSEEALAWKENRFAFTATKITTVISELEIQYDATIELKIEKTSKLLYTGYFSKTDSIESALNIICKSFNFKFEKTEDSSYVIFSE